MKIQISVKYFARLRELMAAADTIVEVDEGTSIGALWQQLATAKQLESQQVLMVINSEYVKPETILKVKDEVAFFPPVTGG